MFQAQNKIGPDTVFLDQSVELTKDGLVDQLLHRYLDYASSKGALSLQSLYFVLWTNFAGLSMSLLTQPSAEEKVVGKIVSGAHPIRQHCASQLEALWVCMLNNYCISVEERLLLMKGCLLQWFEVSLECICMNSVKRSVFMFMCVLTTKPCIAQLVLGFIMFQQFVGNCQITTV